VTLDLLESIQRIVRDELRSVRTAELAVVQDQHPHADSSDNDNYACTVALRNSGVVLKSVPVATPRIGTAAIPAVGELVLVQFLDGDLNAPVIVGRVYSDQHRPPENADGRAVLHLPLDAGDDDAVHFELLTGDTRAVQLKLGKGLTLALRDDDPAVELTIGDAKALLKIEQGGVVTVDVGDGKGTLKIDDAGAIEVAAGSGKGTLKMEQDGAVTVESSGAIKLHGSEVSVQSDGELTLKGSTVNIN
jgi:phage baseplate assembly protein gpV